jgi:NTE family protein
VAVSIAFVLQGGGSLAAGQVGMLRALTEAGIRADLVVGSSAGAINAVAYAQDPTPRGLARLERLWAGLRRRTVFPLNPWHVVAGLAGRRDGLLSPRRLRTLLAGGLTIGRLEDSRIPVGVVATDLATGHAVTLTQGPALDTLLASTSIPGIFPPVPINGRLLADGGVSADIPILQAEALGATVCYVLPASTPPTGPDPARGAVGLVLRALTQVFERTTAAALDATRTQVTVLPMPRQHVASPFDFRHTKPLITEGYVAARAALASRVSTA